MIHLLLWQTSSPDTSRKGFTMIVASVSNEPASYQIPIMLLQNRFWKGTPGLLHAEALLWKCPYRAATTVPARIAVTLADLVLAVDAGEAGFARARVAALASVHASCSIFAWPVVSAVVQICKNIPGVRTTCLWQINIQRYAYKKAVVKKKRQTSQWSISFCYQWEYWRLYLGYYQS